MAKRGGLRASDADRETVAERLRHAAAEGRILTEELEHRLTAAFSARTYGELDQLVDDLPRDVAARRRQSLPIPKPAAMLALLIVMPVVVAVVVAAMVLVVSMFAMWALVAAVAMWIFGARRPMFLGRYYARSWYARQQRWRAHQARAGHGG